MAARGAKTAGRRFGKISTDVIRINVAGTRYYVVANAAAELGMAASSDDGATDCNVYWIDGPVPLERYLELRSYQKINHFPGMGEISRKDALARNIQRMRKENRREYNFYPGTWVLPADHGVLSQHTARLRRRRQRKTFIVKPHHGSMGNGIYLTQSPDAILPSEKAIVQEYLDKPFLLDGFKCDLRIYVLVTSCKPLRILVFKDGLVRLSTERYSPPSDFNLEQMCMHLTNYSINRHSASFDTDERDDRGSKRTLSSFMVWLHKTGHNVVELWAKIHDIIVKTLILAYPHILHSCTVSRHGHLPNGKSQFFEILGFDVLLDHTLQPWVLEVNRSPSFGTDADLDLHIKTAVIRDALKLANISLSDKLTEEACQRQASKRRLKPHTSHTHSGQYDFLAEQADAAAKKASRRAAAKERLTQLRRERELEEFENENKGGYVSVYPTSDPSRARLYSRLLHDALSFNSLGRNYSAQSNRSGSSVGGCGLSGKGRGSRCGLQYMEEPELLEILSQCEDEDSPLLPTRLLVRRPSTSCVQPLALEDSSPLGDMFQVMAARLHEEEQTQRTMVSLREMAPFYPGKSQTEVQAVLERIREDFSSHEAKICSFWFSSLDNSQRKQVRRHPLTPSLSTPPLLPIPQLLAPVTDAVTHLLHGHWRRIDLRGVRLHQITSRLAAFLLGARGHGLRSAISATDRKSVWEAAFKKKHDEALSLAEMECCRRIVELSRCLLYCAYHYHCPHRHKSSNLAPSRTPSLPQLRRCPSLTTPTGLNPTSSRPHSLYRIRS